MAGDNEFVAIAGIDEEATGHCGAKGAGEDQPWNQDANGHGAGGPGGNGGLAEEPVAV